MEKSAVDEILEWLLKGTELSLPATGCVLLTAFFKG